ncbi:ferritin-like domain-containing protein [Desertibaculum subflavum]|uniref:ferritin-like domain-containing protein n=1 Tax=Desertibaculum subflavum TaxID=2268458 RepID=UPI000E66186F
MSQIVKAPDVRLVPARRRFLGTLGTATLSATAVAILAGCERMATAQGGSAANDVQILNVALGLEQEAITAYQLGAESGLLQKPVLDVAVAFQSHHKEHAGALEATIRKLGGAPVAPKSKDEYARALNAASLRNQTDVLKLAQRLERGAANAYIGVIPSFGSKDLAKVAARLAADETMHWTALTSALAEPLPKGALSFGG